MVERLHTIAPDPVWWTEKHTSAWNHVKGALERDWEQTKADFSKKSGQKLNQNVADTVKQSVGSAPIPPLDVKTRPTDPKIVVKVAEKARVSLERESVKVAEITSKAHGVIAKEHQKLGEKVGTVRDDLATEERKAAEKLADGHPVAIEKITNARAKASGQIEAAQDNALEQTGKEHAKIAAAGAKRDEAFATWQEAEQEARYCYSVRSQYPAGSVWDHKLEGMLRSEWDALETGRSWKVSRAEIRRGWDFADKTV
jgi:hypothetical protein